LKKLPSLFGFEVIKNEEDGTVEIDVNCTFPEISNECRKLYQAIEIVLIKEEQLKYPLKIEERTSIIEPTNENIQKYYSLDGFKLFIEENKDKFIDTVTFYKPEIVYVNEEDDLPNIIFHFYNISHIGELNILNPYDFSDNCFISYKNTNLFTPIRIEKLINSGINEILIQYIPIFPVEIIKFNEQGDIKDFRHQELNKPIYNKELW
jgi:hypothetical protein